MSWGFAALHPRLMTGASPKLDIVRTQALKEILALQIRQSMETEGLSKTAMARRMKTSRPALERLLDPGNTSVTLHTLQRAAQAIGKRLRLELIGPN